MALSDYWGRRNSDQRNKNARTTLTGSSPFKELGDSDSLNVSGRCTDSSDCASGWACNGGKCRQTDFSGSFANGGSGDSTGCGDDDGDGGGGGGGQCAPVVSAVIGGEVSQCLKTGCGDDGRRDLGPDGGCGEEYIRLDEEGEPEWNPGRPPEGSACSKWCNDYLAANGSQGPNCSKENTCDECEDCLSTVKGNQCLPKTSGGPCFCEGSDSQCSADDCEACQKDGTCEEDCKTCERCYTTYVECSCGTFKNVCCYSACDQTKGYPECRAEVDCASLCPKPPDNSCEEKCTGVTWCDGEQPEPPCPEGFTCTNNGFITVGDRTCNVRTDCGPPVNDSPGSIDCNCDSDCTGCKGCVNGYCVGTELCPDESAEPEGEG